MTDIDRHSCSRGAIAQSADGDAATSSCGKSGVTARHVILDRALIDDLHERWADLAHMASEPNPFFDPQFVEAVFSLYPADTHPYLLLIEEAGKLIGLAPLGREGRLGRIPVGHASILEHPHQFLTTPLVRKGFERVFAEALLDWLDDAPHNLHFLKLPRQRLNGPVVSAIKRIIDADVATRRVFDVTDQYDRAFERQDLKNDPVLERLSGSLRKQLRAKLRKLEALGVVAYEEVLTPAAVDGWIKEFVDVEHRSWKGKAGTSFLSSPENLAFFQSLMRSYAMQDRLRPARLLLDGKAIALAVDVRAGNCFFAFKSAFDPDYARYSPGVILDVKMIEAFRAGNDGFAIDSCTNGPHDPLDRLWRYRTAIGEIVIGRKQLHHRLALQAPLWGIALKDRLKKNFGA